MLSSDEGLVGQFNDLVADYAVKAVGARAERAHVGAVG